MKVIRDDGECPRVPAVVIDDRIDDTQCFSMFQLLHVACSKVGEQLKARFTILVGFVFDKYRHLSKPQLCAERECANLTEKSVYGEIPRQKIYPKYNISRRMQLIHLFRES
jgi:hypothetical protein